MRSARSLLAIGSVLIFVASASAQRKPASKLEGIVKQQVEAQLGFDRDELDRLVTPDYIEISPLGEFDPREKMLGFYAPDQKPEGLDVSYEISEVSVRDYGKFGIVIARIDYLMSMGGKKMPPRGIRVTLACRKIGKDWKIVSAQYTGIKQAAPPSTK